MQDVLWTMKTDLLNWRLLTREIDTKEKVLFVKDFCEVLGEFQ